MLATEESKAGYPQSKKQPLKFRAHIMPDQVMNRDRMPFYKFCAELKKINRLHKIFC